MNDHGTNDDELSAYLNSPDLPIDMLHSDVSAYISMIKSWAFIISNHPDTKSIEFKDGPIRDSTPILPDLMAKIEHDSEKFLEEFRARLHAIRIRTKQLSQQGSRGDSEAESSSLCSEDSIDELAAMLLNAARTYIGEIKTWVRIIHERPAPKSLDLDDESLKTYTLNQAELMMNIERRSENILEEITLFSEYIRTLKQGISNCSKGDFDTSG